MKTLLTFITLACLIACQEKPVVSENLNPGVVPGFMDKNAKPGNDFFRYANGTWMDTAHFVTGLPYAGALIEITETIDDQLGDIIKEIAAGNNYAANSPEGQIKAIYDGYLDTTGRNALGITPVKKQLDQITSATSKKDIARLMGTTSFYSIFGSDVFLDAKDTKRYVTYTGQGKLGMGSIESYLLEGEPHVSNRAAYLAYIENVFQLAGIDHATQRADAVMRFETAQAHDHWTKAETRDPVRMYHAMRPDELKTYAPGFPWDEFWKAQGRDHLNMIVVHNDTAVKALANTYDKTSLDDLKSYMLFRIINERAKYLTQDLMRAHFTFYEKKMKGVSEGKSLDKLAIECVSTFAYEQLGKAYCNKYYTDDLKNRVETLVQYMKAAVRNSLETNSWMDEPTRKEALRKFDNIHWKIGIPEKYHEFSGLSFSADDLIGNIYKLDKWSEENNASKLTEPKREWEWFMPPHVANAYYQPEMNDVVLPVGILQPPVFDAKADPAALFGGLLAVVGHEVCHGFDDKGSQSDADGLLRNWWSEASRTEFRRRADMLVKQYDAYSPLPGVHLNGQLTLGENIGDLGGINIAYRAYQQYVKDHQNGKAPVIDGLTGDQRFFLAWGQVWSFKTTEQFTRQLAIIDYHSLNNYRVNGTVCNMDTWYATFGVQPGDSLYRAPEDRIVIY